MTISVPQNSPNWLKRLNRWTRRWTTQLLQGVQIQVSNKPVGGMTCCMIHLGRVSWYWQMMEINCKIISVTYCWWPKSGRMSWNACKIPLFAGFWSILSINRSVSPIECLFHSSIWWPYRMKLQPLQRWALRKRWMWASWCKVCHVPSNSKIWFISCSLTIAYLMFLYEIRSKLRCSTVDSLNFTELDDTTLPFEHVWSMICFVQFHDVHRMYINWPLHSICICA